MSFTKNYRALEKNFCILMKQYKGFLENEIYLPDEENRNDLNPFKSNNQLKSNSSKNLIEKEKINWGDSENFFLKENKSLDFSNSQLSFENNHINTGLVKEKQNFISTNFCNLINIRRRRRKFASEEERRVARILKNRRTAEESRQRRIQKMKTLENFVLVSEEREKNSKEEIRVIGLQSAFRAVELIILNKEYNLIKIKKP